MNKDCEHKFVHLDTKKTAKSEGYNTCFERIDNYFCEKCLDYKATNRRESSRDKPEWY